MLHLDTESLLLQLDQQGRGGWEWLDGCGLEGSFELTLYALASRGEKTHSIWADPPGSTSPWGLRHCRTRWSKFSAVSFSRGFVSSWYLAETAPPLYSSYTWGERHRDQGERMDIPRGLGPDTWVGPSIHPWVSDLYGGAKASDGHRGEDVSAGGEVEIVSVSLHRHSQEVQLQPTHTKKTTAVSRVHLS